jgi:hypothetical protein
MGWVGQTIAMMSCWIHSLRTFLESAMLIAIEVFWSFLGGGGCCQLGMKYTQLSDSWLDWGSHCLPCIFL